MTEMCTVCCKPITANQLTSERAGIHYHTACALVWDRVTREEVEPETTLPKAKIAR